MRVVVFGAINGAVALGFGAFGAHLLGGQMVTADPDAFGTAVMFHLIVSATLIALGALKGHVLPVLLAAASWLLGVGMILFSGSIYAQALGAPAIVGSVAPVGGGLMILGYLVVAVAAARRL